MRGSTPRWSTGARLAAQCELREQVQEHLEQTRIGRSIHRGDDDQRVGGVDGVDRLSQVRVGGVATEQGFAGKSRTCRVRTLCPAALNRRLTCVRRACVLDTGSGLAEMLRTFGILTPWIVVS